MLLTPLQREQPSHETRPRRKSCIPDGIGRSAPFPRIAHVHIADCGDRQRRSHLPPRRADDRASSAATAARAHQCGCGVPVRLGDRRSRVGSRDCGLAWFYGALAGWPLRLLASLCASSAKPSCLADHNLSDIRDWMGPHRSAVLESRLGGAADARPVFPRWHGRWRCGDAFRPSCGALRFSHSGIAAVRC